jgi:hypothetical protein
MVIISAAELAELVRDAVSDALAAQRPAAAEEPMLLTCAALCRKLGISRATVYRWRHGGMPSIKWGDEYRYVLTEALSWLRSKGGAP